MLQLSLPVLVQSALTIEITSIRSYDYEDVHDTLTRVLPSVIFIPSSTAS